MSFQFSVSTPAGPKNFNLEVGSSIYFVGANGGGKTRLAVYIEDMVGTAAHRISAHRALKLNPGVPKISENKAIKGLRFGYQEEGSNLAYRASHRWGNNVATQLLNDYDFLIQALFADQSNISLQSHTNYRASNGIPPEQTKFEKLLDIWERILPHRTLHVSGDDIQVSYAGMQNSYAAPEMSDGERTVFYLIAQTLVAAKDSLIIFDEPELHIHRAVLGRLWDELEAARPDCATIVISHDLEFVASRNGQKFVISEYSPEQGWLIEDVPEETGFSEKLTTLILGSRKPVLFVEGTGSSLDSAVYRACFPDWTIITRGSCEEVIHSVVTMRANSSFTRISCSGIVDADDYSSSEIGFLKSKGIGILPVSEIENLFLIPEVIKVIATEESFSGSRLDELCEEITNGFYSHVGDAKNYKRCVLDYCRRRIDRILKKIDLSESKDVEALIIKYSVETQGFNIREIAQNATDNILNAIKVKDTMALLRCYDNKGILQFAAKAKGTTVPLFEQWIVRALRNGTVPNLTIAVKKYLPNVVPG